MQFYTKRYIPNQILFLMCVRNGAVIEQLVFGVDVFLKKRFISQYM
jgi:hypothetical protein